MENTNLSAPIAISMFAVYNGKGHSFGIIWPAVLINLIGIPGQLMNVFVVYVTIRNRSMRSTCNYLLAMLSFFEFLHQTGHLVALYVALSGINYIPYQASMNLQIQAMFGLHAAQIALMAIALDRLISVLLPVWSRNLKFRQCMPFVAVPCCLVGIFGAVNCYLVVLSKQNLCDSHHVNERNKKEERRVMTASLRALKFYVNAYKGWTVSTISEPYNDICLCANAINIVCYVVIGLKLRMSMKAIGMDQKYNRRIYKALVAIVLVVLGGYLINMIFGKFIVNSGLYKTSIEKWYGTQMFCAHPAAIAAASHAPILYTFSTEYREAIRKEINILMAKLGKRLIGVESFMVRRSNSGSHRTAMT